MLSGFVLSDTDVELSSGEIPAVRVVVAEGTVNADIVDRLLALNTDGSSMLVCLGRNLTLLGSSPSSAGGVARAFLRPSNPS